MTPPFIAFSPTSQSSRCFVKRYLGQGIQEGPSKICGRQPLTGSLTFRGCALRQSKIGNIIFSKLTCRIILPFHQNHKMAWN